MFGQQSEALYRARAESTANQPELHNVDASTSGSSSDHVPNAGRDAATGTWGERDVGGPLNTMSAYGEYEALRREMTSLSFSKTKSRDSATTRTKSRGTLARTRSAITRPRTVSTTRRSELEGQETKETDAEGQAEDEDEKWIRAW